MLLLGSKQQETTMRTITSVEIVLDSLHAQMFPSIPAGLTSYTNWVNNR